MGRKRDAVARGVYVRFVARSPEQQEHTHVEYPFVPYCWMADICFSIGIFLTALWNIILIQHSSDRPMGILVIPFGPPWSTTNNMFINDFFSSSKTRSSTPRYAPGALLMQETRRRTAITTWYLSYLAGRVSTKEKSPATRACSIFAESFVCVSNDIESRAHASCLSVIL